VKPATSEAPATRPRDPIPPAPRTSPTSAASRLPPEPSSPSLFGDAGPATAIYIAGTTRLEPGRRYSIAITNDRLRVQGPIDANPTVVALDRPLSGIDASAINGRLVLTEAGSRAGAVLAFMGISGTTPQQLAAEILAAAHLAAGQR
jgi:hypothetical protein